MPSLRSWIRKLIPLRVAKTLLKMAPYLSHETQRNHYYDQAESCQIPPLSFLISKYLGNTNSGMVVEIGAHNGIAHSNSLGPISAGWSALLVEPNNSLAQECRRNHAGNRNVTVHEIAITQPGIETLTLFLADTLSSAEPQIIKRYENLPWARGSIQGSSKTVKATSLDLFLKTQCVDPHFELLSIDVEGHESSVLAGFDLDFWKPKMIIIEFCDDHPDLADLCANDALLRLRIENAGYVVVFRDTSNTVFIRSEIWRQHLPSQSSGPL